MQDSYFLRILPNGQILVRINNTGETKIMKPRELENFFRNELEDQFKEWDERDGKLSEIEEFKNYQDRLSDL